MTDSFEILPESIFNEDDESQISTRSQETKDKVCINLDDSFEPIVGGPAKVQKKPKLVPSLDFKKLNHYNNVVKQAKMKKNNPKNKIAKADDFDEIESILSHAMDDH